MFITYSYLLIYFYFQSSYAHYLSLQIIHNIFLSAHLHGLTCAFSVIKFIKMTDWLKNTNLSFQLPFSGLSSWILRNTSLSWPMLNHWPGLMANFHLAYLSNMLREQLADSQLSSKKGSIIFKYCFWSIFIPLLQKCLTKACAIIICPTLGKQPHPTSEFISQAIFSFQRQVNQIILLSLCLATILSVISQPNIKDSFEQGEVFKSCGTLLSPPIAPSLYMMLVLRIKRKIPSSHQRFFKRYLGSSEFILICFFYGICLHCTIQLELYILYFLQNLLYTFLPHQLKNYIFEILIITISTFALIKLIILYFILYVSLNWQKYINLNLSFQFLSLYCIKLIHQQNFQFRMKVQQFIKSKFVQNTAFILFLSNYINQEQWVPKMNIQKIINNLANKIKNHIQQLFGNYLFVMYKSPPDLLAQCINYNNIRAINATKLDSLAQDQQFLFKMGSPVSSKTPDSIIFKSFMGLQSSSNNTITGSLGSNKNARSKYGNYQNPQDKKEISKGIIDILKLHLNSCAQQKRVQIPSLINNPKLYQKKQSIESVMPDLQNQYVVGSVDKKNSMMSSKTGKSTSNSTRRRRRDINWPSNLTPDSSIKTIKNPDYFS